MALLTELRRPWGEVSVHADRVWMGAAARDSIVSIVLRETHDGRLLGFTWELRTLRSQFDPSDPVPLASVLVTDLIEPHGTGVKDAALAAPKGVDAADIEWVIVMP